MNSKSLKILLVSTPIGPLGSGKGGGVELTLNSLVKGLVSLGHKVTLVAPSGSFLSSEDIDVEIKYITGEPQASWQHQRPSSPVVIPFNGVLPRLLEEAIRLGEKADAVLNFGYDWLPIWITPFVRAKIFHLISMGAESKVMKELISDLSISFNSRMAFHSHRQASDYLLADKPFIVGNGLDLNNYDFQPCSEGHLGWAGRVAPEKGLEDAASVANSLGEKLLVWGLIENTEYAEFIENSFPKGTIQWRGFLPTDLFQKEVGRCRAFLNTPKWNEAYGNVVVEAMACGVPVIAYDRGGPGELINSGVNGILVTPDNIEGLINATKKINKIERKSCREWVQDFASIDVFAKKVESWLISDIDSEKFKNK